MSTDTATHRVMLCVPVVHMSDGVLCGKPGDIAEIHWAEARSAEAAGLVVVLDDIDTEARALGSATT
jgi:hypothetical protein